MSQHPPRQSRRLVRSEYLAGWVFADILLVMMLVAFGTQVPLPTQPKPTPSPTAAPTASPRPTQRPEKPRIAMSPKPKIVRLTVDVEALLAGGKRRAAQFRRIDRQIRERTAHYTGRRAGMVLVWGQEWRVETGQEVARQVSSRLKKARPVMFRDAAEPRELWKKSRDTGTVLLEIYLFA